MGRTPLGVGPSTSLSCRIAASGVQEARGNLTMKNFAKLAYILGTALSVLTSTLWLASVLSQEQLSEIGNLYRPDQKIPEATFLRAVRTKTGKVMLRSELTGLMAEHGITPAHVITQHQKIIEDALASGQLGVAEKANKQFIEMLDLTPDKVTVTEKLEGGIRFDHLIAAREETKQLDQ
jgi:hypothetical protein